MDRSKPPEKTPPDCRVSKLNRFRGWPGCSCQVVNRYSSFEPTIPARIATRPMFHMVSTSMPCFLARCTVTSEPMMRPEATRSPYVGRKKCPTWKRRGYKEAAGSWLLASSLTDEAWVQNLRYRGRV